MRRLLVLTTAAAFGMVLQTTLTHLMPDGWVAPDILLVVCVYLGLREHSVGGSVGAFLLGYLQDSLSGGTAGVNAFGMCLVFTLVYLTSRRLWVDNVVSRVVVVFLASLVKTAASIALLTLFLSLEEWQGFTPALFLQPALAALIAPPIMAGLSGALGPEDETER